MQGASDKALCWGVQDFSEEVEGTLEKLAARFNKVEQCKEFEAAFEAAKKFNNDAKEGAENLVWAEIVEDIDEPVVDDIDENKTHEEGDE